MTDRELMQQALGYMESVGQMDMHPEEWAIAVALRERLAQPYPDNFIDALMYDVAKRDSEALAEQPANVATVNTSEELVDKTAENVHEQPAQQEPVAHCRVRPLRGDQSFPTVEVDWVSRPVPGPLYTTPPASKPWVGLTQKEIQELKEEGIFLANCEAITEVIEAKLREKNNG